MKNNSEEKSLTTPQHNLLQVEFGKPVRFLALEWREAWEFDHPSVLLEPVVSYSPNGVDCESMIEDETLDIALSVEEEEEISAEIHPSDLKEFEWRGWNVNELHQKAEALLRGEKIDLGIGYVAVREQYIVFWKNADGEVEFEYQSGACSCCGRSTEVKRRAALAARYAKRKK